VFLEQFLIEEPSYNENE